MAVTTQQVAAADLVVGDQLQGSDQAVIVDVRVHHDGRLQVTARGRQGAFSFFPEPLEPVPLAGPPAARAGQAA
jgi:hypothetical protein